MCAQNGIDDIISWNHKVVEKELTEFKKIINDDKEDSDMNLSTSGFWQSRLRLVQESHSKLLFWFLVPAFQNTAKLSDERCKLLDKIKMLDGNSLMDYNVSYNNWADESWFTSSFRFVILCIKPQEKQRTLTNPFSSFLMLDEWFLDLFRFTEKILVTIEERKHCDIPCRTIFSKLVARRTISFVKKSEFLW